LPFIVLPRDEAESQEKNVDTLFIIPIFGCLITQPKTPLQLVYLAITFQVSGKDPDVVVF